MTEQNSQNEKPQKERRYDPELLKKGLKCDIDQYEMLIRCSENESMKEWNKWRMKNPTQDIFLEGADFSFFYLRNASFNQQTPDSEQRKKSKINSKVFFKEANFDSANLINSRLTGADLEKVCLVETRLDKASLRGARLKRAFAWSAHFENANLSDSNLERAVIQGAYLQGTCVKSACLLGTNFHLVHVDESTIIWKCMINRYTDFSGVSLDICQIDPSTKQLLEYNIRRKNWEGWYADEDEPIRKGVFIFSNKRIRLTTNKILTWLVRRFWEISDYGISTKHIIWTFFAWAVIFAVVYLAWGLIDYHLLGVKDYPGIVSNLFVLEDSQQGVSPWLVPFRAVYFSIVTMTTLGFGDMYASAHGFLRGLCGHVLLALQVILGYVLLGALVTRFAVLFTAGGPAGKFADEKKEATEATEGTEKNE